MRQPRDRAPVAPGDDRVPTSRIERRAFLQKVALGGAVGLGSALSPAARPRPAGAAQQLDDRELAAFAESVELALVAVYESVTPLLSSPVLAVVEVVLGHHEEHAEAFAELAGSSATGRPNATLMETLGPIVDGLSGQSDALSFAASLENQMVTTYTHSLTVLEDPEVVTSAATVVPVECGHAITLSLLLDGGPEAWFPTGAFESADLAQGFDPAVFPAS